MNGDVNMLIEQPDKVVYQVSRSGKIYEYHEDILINSTGETLVKTKEYLLTEDGSKQLINEFDTVIRVEELNSEITLTVSQTDIKNNTVVKSSTPFKELEVNLSNPPETSFPPGTTDPLLPPVIKEQSLHTQSVTSTTRKEIARGGSLTQTTGIWIDYNDGTSLA